MKKFDNFCPGCQIKKIQALFYINYGVFNVIKCFFLLMILLTKSPGSPKKLPKSPQEGKKISGQKSLNIFIAILVQTMTPKTHFEID